MPLLVIMITVEISLTGKNPTRASLNPETGWRVTKKQQGLPIWSNRKPLLS